MTVGQYVIYQMFLGVEKSIVENLLPLIKQNEKYLIAVCNCKIPREAFLKVYRTLPRIEGLPEDEKKQLKDYVKMNFKSTDVTQLVENAKIVYTVGKLI